MSNTVKDDWVSYLSDRDFDRSVYVIINIGDYIEFDKYVFEILGSPTSIAFKLSRTNKKHIAIYKPSLGCSDTVEISRTRSGGYSIDASNILKTVHYGRGSIKIKVPIEFQTLSNGQVIGVIDLMDF